MVMIGSGSEWARKWDKKVKEWVNVYVWVFRKIRDDLIWNFNSISLARCSYRNADEIESRLYTMRFEHMKI